MTQEQKDNIVAIVNEARSKGITNVFSIAAILSIISKETGFNYTAESSYRNTPNLRIRKIFGSRVAMYTESDLDTLKQKDVQFFDTVYGYKTKMGIDGGNTSVGDGFKYRGRGANQITFKGTYKKVGEQIGMDLINNPELLNTPIGAAKSTIQYFINSFKSAKGSTLAIYHSTGINDFKSLPDSVGAFYHANAGFRKSSLAIKADPTGGLKTANTVSSTFLALLNKGSQVVSENKGAVTGTGLFFLE